jgi:uncharacterized protein with PIN domain
MHAYFRFFAGLSDFLPADRRQETFRHDFNGNPSIKDTIEAIGIPHPEVDLILVNGESVGLSRLRPVRLGEARFVLDTHLGRLAGYLRMFGFDALYENDYTDERLAQIASEEGRILLTKDRGLLKRNTITYGYCIRSVNPRDKLIEVIHRFDLYPAVVPFRRCIRCNETLENVEKGEIIEKLPSQVREHYEEFRRCTGCGQVYWKGTHFERMERFLDWILKQNRR